MLMTHIVDKFESFFSQACSVNTEQGSDKLKAQYNSMRDTYCGTPLTDDHTFDV